MNSTKRWVMFPILMLLVTMSAAPLSLAQEKFFELEKVKPGMNGKGYSVFSGTKIDDFDVKVLAVVEGDVGRDKLILVQLSGKPLEQSGGLAAGMSGSPVYIRGKLLGAISYGFENADSYLALVTPIENMLRMLPIREQSVYYKGGLYKFKRDSFQPVVSPVIVTGMGKRGFDALSAALEPYRFKPVFFGGRKNRETPGFVRLEPGSAVAVQVVSGDYQVSAIGTVTMVEGENFLAFGHSFTNRGKVDYLAYQAQILHTIKSQVMSFKIGLPLQKSGRIVEDRQNGILGRFGEFPRLIPVMVNVKDLDRNLSRTSSFQVIDNEQMYRDLIVSGVTDAIDQAINRVGSGTALVKIQVEFDNISGPWQRDNLFYGKDIAVSSLQDLRELLDLLTTNEFSQVALKSIEVNVEVQEKRRSARILKIETARSKVRPGEKVKLQAIIQTFRGEKLAIPFEIELPDNIESGKLTLTAHGSSTFITEPEAGDRKKSESKSGAKQADSLEELLKDFFTGVKNNQIIMEYQIKESNGLDKKEIKEIKLKSDTLYCIHNEAQFDLEIEKNP